MRRDDCQETIEKQKFTDPVMDTCSFFRYILVLVRIDRRAE